MRTSVLALLCAALQTAAAADKEAVINSPAIKQYYQDALASYARDDYREAIIKWTAILKEDPDQRTAKTMIIEARQRIAVLTKERRRRAFAFIASGQYRKAFLELQVLLDQDPGDPELQATQRRLESVIKLAPRINAKTRAARAAALGLKGFLAVPPDLKLAHNGLRYARELAADEELYGRLLRLLYGEYPALATADAVTPGMKLLEYKHHVALHQIYDAKHHLAVITLDEILTLEPEDLMALKRLGSAYYSLGRMSEARSAWSAALKLAPRDKTLARFLAKIDKAKKYRSNAGKR
ncbi:MAG: tetratricopeptide repeat protein [Elusimicrobia bacterium]|nr:tetratricopeptide repeat protein [Elusimicrobiota bacterium]